MENINNSMDKLEIYKVFHRLKCGGRKVLEKLKNKFENNRFITVASILFALFSLINLILILYFVKIVNESFIVTI